MFVLSCEHNAELTDEGLSACFECYFLMLMWVMKGKTFVVDSCYKHQLFESLCLCRRRRVEVWTWAKDWWSHLWSLQALNRADPMVHSDTLTNSVQYLNYCLLLFVTLKVVFSGWCWVHSGGELLDTFPINLSKLWSSDPSQHIHVHILLSSQDGILVFLYPLSAAVGTTTNKLFLFTYISQ